MTSIHPSIHLVMFTMHIVVCFVCAIYVLCWCLCVAYFILFVGDHEIRSSQFDKETHPVFDAKLEL